jgi:hypothetical protein
MYNSDYWTALASLAVAVLTLASLPGANSLTRQRGRALVDDDGSPSPPGRVADGVGVTAPGQPRRPRTSKSYVPVLVSDLDQKRTFGRVALQARAPLRRARRQPTWSSQPMPR